MERQESSAIKRALESLIEFISTTAEGLLEKAMFLDSKMENFEEEEVIEIREKVRQIKEVNEEFTQLAKEINEQKIPEEIKEKKVNNFIGNVNKRYRHS